MFVPDAGHHGRDMTVLTVQRPSALQKFQESKERRRSIVESEFDFLSPLAVPEAQAVMWSLTTCPSGGSIPRPWRRHQLAPSQAYLNDFGVPDVRSRVHSFSALAFFDERAIELLPGPTGFLEKVPKPSDCHCQKH